MLEDVFKLYKKNCVKLNQLAELKMLFPMSDYKII